MRVKQIDTTYMRRAIELARRGQGWVNPNPLVGCVVVRDGRIIGEGWHARFGEAHAERAALAACAKAGESAAGATVYVTLEPCAHCASATNHYSLMQVFVNGEKD